MLYALVIIAVLSSVSAACVKLIGSVISGSVALLADGADSLVNILSILLALHLFMKSEKPPDIDHPYGHYGFEVLSAILTSIIMVVIVIIVGLFSFLKIQTEHEIGQIGLYFSMISTLLVIISVYIIHKASRKYESLALRAETRHLLVDVVESFIVLGGVASAIILNPYFDIFAALVVTALMGYGIFTNLREVSESIVYRFPRQLERELIRRLVMNIPEVAECHAIRVRRLGKAIFADLHVLVDPEMSIERAHDLAHKIEKMVKKNIEEVREVIVHIEPLGGSNEVEKVDF